MSEKDFKNLLKEEPLNLEENKIINSKKKSQK